MNPSELERSAVELLAEIAEQACIRQREHGPGAATCPVKLRGHEQLWCGGCRARAWVERVEQG